MPFISPLHRRDPDSVLRGRTLLLVLTSLLALVLLSSCAGGTAGTGPSAPASETASADPAGAETTTEPAEAADDSQPTDASAAGSPGSGSEEGHAGSSTTGTALAMLGELEVKGRAPKTGYDGDLFDWRSDVDHNGCDTRNDVLRRDLREITIESGTKGCKVIAGTLDDPYKGATYAFDRDPNNIDIDHIVARSNAWQTGAFAWDEATLREFGNDPLNLLAVSSSLNRQKGDADAATWLPPAKGYRCEYVARQIAIKHKYELWVVPAEKSAMERVLGTCEGQPAFTEDVSWPDPGEGDNVTTGREEDSGSDGSSTVHFKNCTAARAAGAAPVHAGDPGYGRHLDRDGDGVGCE